jgi:magnesium chelatase subunit ChlD-like protein
LGAHGRQPPKKALSPSPARPGPHRAREGRIGLEAHGTPPALQAAATAGIDWPRTLAARGAQRLRAEHLRRAHRQPQTAVLHCFLLDCSASMLGGERLALAKGLLVELLAQVYRWRDRAAVLGFGGSGIDVWQAPGPAAVRHAPWLAAIGGGGGTPLADALRAADALLARHRSGPRWIWLLSDCRSRDVPERPRHAEHIRLIDFERARPALGRAAALAQHWGAVHIPAPPPGSPPAPPAAPPAG